MDSERTDTGLTCLVQIARFHGLAADAAQIAHQQGMPAGVFDVDGLVRAGRGLGLKVQCIGSRWNRLADTPLPAIAQHKDGHFFVLAGVKEDKVLIQDPLELRPMTLPRPMFEQAWCGRLILITRRATLQQPGSGFGFGWFVPAIVKYRKLFAEVLVASFFLQLFALITPLFFQVVIDKVLVHRGLTTLDVLAVGLLAVSFFDVVLAGLRTYVFAHTTNRIDVLLGAKLFGHLLRLPLAYFEARRVGDSVARVRELENIRNFLTGSALTLVIDLFFTLVFLAVLYYYSPVLTAVVAGAIPCYIVLSVWVTPVLRRRLEEKFNRGAENQAFLVESVTGIQTLKAMAVEPQLQRRWEDQLAGYVGASFRAANLGNIASQVAGLINKVTVVLILWLGATLVIRGELSVGQLIAFNMLAARISGPILRLVQLWQDFQQAGISVRRLGDILNAPSEPGYNPGRATLPDLRGAVRFDHVGFRYAPERPQVLHGVTLDVRPGEVIGIVGRSGSGKSTLTKLIQRLYVPESGRVLVDGVDLALVEPAWLRRQVGVVLQESFLFNCSVRENIALTNPGLPMEPVTAAAKLAGAHDFILELPEGYDTKVGEQGANLSGGQRQRIAIARALITNPRILILDEATSALDYESERAIQANMAAICQGRTVLIIAHRLSAVRRADRILVLDQGRVVEQGSHDALLGNKGLYARLYALQSGLPQRQDSAPTHRPSPAGRGVRGEGRGVCRSASGPRCRRMRLPDMNARTETAFLPAALEILDTPPSPAGRATLWVVIGFMTSVVIWACLGEVDIVAVAAGRIIPSGHSKTVQPLELGTVMAVRVAEGQQVRAGEAVIELDPSSARADVERLQQERQATSEEIGRLEQLAAWLAEEGGPSAESGPVPDVLLRSQWREFQDRLAVLARERDRLAAERDSVQRQVDKLADVLPLVKQRAEDQQGLAEKKLLPYQHYLETEQQRRETHHDLRTQRARVVELDNAIHEATARTAYTRSTFHREVLERKAESVRRMSALRQELIKAETRLQAQVLRAPVDGVVQQLAVRNVGAVVTPAQDLMVIVPQHGQIEVEAMLKNQDIGFVESGQRAEIKVDAFPFTKYGTIDGEIVDLSDDAVADDQGVLGYKMRVALDQSEIMANGKPISLSPGMTVMVEAKTGRRRLIEYFLGPLLQYGAESARER